MRYPVAMALLVSLLMTMAASSGTTPARRIDAGSSATATVGARIISASARIGAGFAPPMARMVPRRTTFNAADGRPVAALVYDFE